MSPSQSHITLPKLKCDPPKFTSIQVPAPWHLLGLQAHTNDIAAAPRFTHGQTADLSSVDKVRKVLGLLLLGSMSVDLIDTKV